MLTPEELLELVDTMQPVLDDLNTWITKDLIRRFMARMEGTDLHMTNTDTWQVQLYQEAGGHVEALQREIANFTELAEEEVRRIFEDAGIRAYAADCLVYAAAGLQVEELADNERMLRILQDTYERTNGEIFNFTRTTAQQSQKRLMKALDNAHMKVVTGAQSYTGAVREAVEELAKGQAEVVYPTGHVDTLETAVLRAVRTGTAQASGNMALQGMIDHDWDIVLVSAHLGARYGDGGPNPGNHHWWQGKFYTRTGATSDLPNFFEATGYGTGEGLSGWNCRHSFGPGDGVHNPYTQYDTEENRKAYDLSQKQRAMERAIRKTKRELLAYREAINTCTDPVTKEALQWEYDKTADKLKKQNAAYKEFCKTNDLKPYDDRLYTAKWSREEASRAVGAAKRYKKAANQSKAADKLKSSKNSEPAAEPKTTVNDSHPTSTTLVDVLDEYVQNATPGVGTITYADGYERGKHSNEIKTANWLHDTFGGDIVLLNESDESGHKMPDYLWRGKMWELKNTSTAKAADSALRKGLKQIVENPGGIVLDYGEQELSMRDILDVVESRLIRGGNLENDMELDVMIVLKGNAVKIIRKTKK